MIEHEEAVTIRAMQASDIPAVAILEAEAQQDPWSEAIFSNCLKYGYSCWCLCVPGQVVGYGLTTMQADECHILTLCLSAPYRGRGLAQQLLQFLLSEAREAQATRIILEVRPSNLAAGRLYEKFGFHVIGRRKEYYRCRDGTREDALVMQLKLP